MATQDHSIKGNGYGNVYIDALIAGRSGWNENSGPITWYLADADDVRENGDPRAQRYGTWSAAEKIAFKLALENYSSVTKLTFQEAADAPSANLVEWKVETGYIQRTKGEVGAAALHEYPVGGGHFGNSSQIWGYYESERVSSSGPSAGQRAFDYMYRGATGIAMLSHELGHAMGLNHPFGAKTERFPGVRAGNGDDLGTDGECQAPFTVMSYNPYWDQEVRPDYRSGRMGTLGAFDIAALQRMYGKNTDYHKGNDTYGLSVYNAPGATWTCIWDAGGTDTIDNSGSNISSTIDLRAATLSPGPNAGGYISNNDGIQGGLTIANGVVIENARGGSAPDLIDGNDANNLLEGRGGADAIAGRGGNDELNGGTEHDSLVGGLGDDVYLLYDLSGGRYDTAFERTGQGTDLVRVRLIDGSGVTSYTLGDNIENGAITSTSGRFTLIGNAGENQLYGDRGDDTLKGGIGRDTLNGGWGIDTLDGGAGGDVFYLTDLNPTGFYDTVVETASGGGTDIVQVTAIDPGGSRIGAYALTAFVEDCVVVGDAAFNLDANALSNRLTGNDQRNVINGLGGHDRLNGRGGVDRLVGGAGDDTYVLTDMSRIPGSPQSVFDGVEEAPGEGVDTVLVLGQNYPGLSSRANYILTAHVENATVTGTAGFVLSGNGLANTLSGNAGANDIDGRGGADILDGRAGYDHLSGGEGSDTYILDTLSLQTGAPRLVFDLVEEAANEGTDTVMVRGQNYPGGTSRFLYVLTDNVENGVITGSGGFYLTGNALANKLTGNAGDNILDGRLGSDTLTGGAGRDGFTFSTALGTSNVDRIMGYAVNEDTIRLDNAVFRTLGDVGALSANRFKDITASGVRLDADDRILYDNQTGALYYDPDGSGAGRRVMFAIVDNDPVLSAGEFLIV